MSNVTVILELARKLVDQMEADKHRDQPELLEVRLLQALEVHDTALNWDNPVVIDDDGEI